MDGNSRKDSLPDLTAIMARNGCEGSARSQLSAFLKGWRAANGLPLKALAGDMGVSIETVSAWERGHRFPGAENLDKLAAYTGVPISCFFCRQYNHSNGCSNPAPSHSA